MSVHLSTFYLANPNNPDAGFLNQAKSWDRARRVTIFSIMWFALFLPLLLPAEPVGENAAIEQALQQPWGQHFWIERHAGRYKMGDPTSDFNDCNDVANLSFDIGNNVMLANVGVQGELKAVTSYRNTYKTVTSGWPGVWTCKDTSTYGPYAFTLEIDGQTNHLDTVTWDFRSGLLDNLFPITEFTGPSNRFTVRLLTFAPVSADGTQRLRGVVYGLQLVNNSPTPLDATIVLPKCSSGETPYHRWSQSDQYGAFDFGLGDAAYFSPRLSVHLKQGEFRWVPLVICGLGEGVQAAVNQRGTAAWLADSEAYYRGLIGRLTTADEPFVGELYERSVMQALQALAEAGNGELAGANWGSVPPTRMNWSKDTYYSSLPFMTLDPALAESIIQWFDTYGVRPESVVLRGDEQSFAQAGQPVGGVNHSISLSIAAPLMAGLLYDHDGDVNLFRRHPEWKHHWEEIIDAILSSRQEENVWLFPTRFISDGPVRGDFHTGSNVCVWRALTAMSRLEAEVWNDPTASRRYADAAEKVKAAIMAKCVIDGSFGKQFIEASWRDGRKPEMESDGEESDTTLMPYYGFLSQDDETYLNYMRFSMSTNNHKYDSGLNSLTWEGCVPSTAPGYNKGLCAATDHDSLFGERGAFTTLQKVTDADGSIWWWSYGCDMGPHPQLMRAYNNIGKSGWASGVVDLVITSRFLGVDYDAPRHDFRFHPMAAIGDFSWLNFPMGHDRFSVSCKKVHSGYLASFENHNDHFVKFEAALPAEGLRTPLQVTRNGRALNDVAMGEYLGRRVVCVTLTVEAQESVELSVINKK